MMKAYHGVVFKESFTALIHPPQSPSFLLDFSDFTSRSSASLDMSKIALPGANGNLSASRNGMRMSEKQSEIDLQKQGWDRWLH